MSSSGLSQPNTGNTHQVVSLLRATKAMLPRAAYSSSTPARPRNDSRIAREMRLSFSYLFLLLALICLGLWAGEPAAQGQSPEVYLARIEGGMDGPTRTGESRVGEGGSAR